MAEDVLVSEGRHDSFGWLRRPEMDTDTPDGKPLGAIHYCYESPEGDLFYTPFDRHKKYVRIRLYAEADTGEHYLEIGG